MRIITTRCPDCETIVAANELESTRVMKCPGLDCDHVFRFEEAFTAEERDHFLTNREQYELQESS